MAFFYIREGSSFNWSQIADVVIGRPAYDNYLVAMAIRMGVNVIDATRTMIALHLSTPGVREEGRTNADSAYNVQAVGPFPWNHGLTTSSRFMMTFDSKGNELLVIRKGH